MESGAPWFRETGGAHARAAVVDPGSSSEPLAREPLAEQHHRFTAPANMNGRQAPPPVGSFYAYEAYSAQHTGGGRRAEVVGELVGRGGHPPERAPNEAPSALPSGPVYGRPRTGPSYDRVVFEKAGASVPVEEFQAGPSTPYRPPTYDVRPRPPSSHLSRPPSAHQQHQPQYTRPNPYSHPNQHHGLAAHGPLGSSSSTAMSSSPAAFEAAPGSDAVQVGGYSASRPEFANEPSTSSYGGPVASPPFPSHLASHGYPLGDREAAYERRQTLGRPSSIGEDDPTGRPYGQRSTGMVDESPYSSTGPGSRAESADDEAESRWREGEGRMRGQHQDDRREWRDANQLDHLHLARPPHEQHPQPAYYPDQHPQHLQPYPAHANTVFPASHQLGHPALNRPYYPPTSDPLAPSSSSSASAAYPAQAVYAQPPPPSWSHTPAYSSYGGQDPYSQHVSHPHAYAGEPLHPQTISPTTFAVRPPQQTPGGSTDQSPYASYHSSYSGEDQSQGGSPYEDDLAYPSGADTSPDGGGHWSDHPHQGGAVGWANSAGVSAADVRIAGGSARRQGFVQDGSGRMAYDEPHRGVVKMGGKQVPVKKRGRGVDGRGKGEENWIGGQKTRRQVKNACQTCQKLHKPCDEARPCGRCIKRGPKFADECRDSDRKPKKGQAKVRTRGGASNQEPTATTARGENGFGGTAEMEPPAMPLRERVGDRVPPALPPLDDEAYRRRKASEDSAYASSLQHSRSSTSSASSSTFPMHFVYGDQPLRRTSSLMHQVMDPARIAEDDGFAHEDDEFGVRGWRPEEKEQMERQDQHHGYAPQPPRSPFPLQAPIGHPHMGGAPFALQAAHPLGAGHLPSAHYPTASSYYHPHPPPPHDYPTPLQQHQPSSSSFHPTPPTSAESYQLHHPPPRNGSAAGRQAPPPSLSHLPMRARLNVGEEGDMDPPPSPRGDGPTPEAYRRSPPRRRSLLGGAVEEGDEEAARDEVVSSEVVEPTTA